MTDELVANFFESLVDDNESKEIIELILRGDDEEQIVETLLGGKRGAKK